MLFYEQLVRISPTLCTRTGYAAALGEANGPEAGLAVLDGIDQDAVSAYQPYWAVRAHLLQRLGKTLGGRGCFRPGDRPGRGPSFQTCQEGHRPGAGAKPKPKIVPYTLTKGLAAKFLADQLTERRWQELRDAADQRLRFDVEKYIWDRAAGRPVQQMRVPSPEGEKFQVEVDVTSARNKLLAALGC